MDSPHLCLLLVLLYFAIIALPIKGVNTLFSMASEKELLSIDY